MKVYWRRPWRWGWVVVGVVACKPAAQSWDPIFLNGRAVAAAGDTLLAFTRLSDPGIMVRDRRTGAVYSRGGSALASPYQVQELGGHWYVSDARSGKYWIDVFSSDWDLERQIPLDGLTSVPHQFAVLPDGRIVLEANDTTLIAVDTDPDNSVEVFAHIEADARPGMLIAANGGVVYAAPGTSIILFNEHGNVRWHAQWPWNDNAYMADLAVDWRGRIHALLGGDQNGTFRAFTLDRNTGEPIRWSEPSATASFVVGRLGELQPDSIDTWVK